MEHSNGSHYHAFDRKENNCGRKFVRGENTRESGPMDTPLGLLQQRVL